jgi:formylglycine-generating enzyme required for sulfatase activity
MKNRATLKAALLALLGAACAPVGTAAQQRPTVTWPAIEWNPNPTGDDVVIPLPCGGAMAFRRVFTSGAYSDAEQSLLEDQKVVLGATEEDIPAVGYLRTDYVSGPFEDRDRARYYLMGKYEVSVRQYAAVMTGDCNARVEMGSLPASDLSWFDAMEFTRKANQWINQNAATSLPKANGRPGFMRLPVEVEWEFAVRGGLAVPEAERANPTFVRSGTALNDYAWYAGAGSSGGEKHPIGQRKPNALGLYDMLGNVEEMVFDLFHMVRVSRLHGQPGSVISRGGSFQTTAESMRSSTRTELPLYDSSGKQELRLKDVGFRVSLGAAAIGDFGRAQALQRRWNKILDEAKTTTAQPQTPLQTLEKLTRDTTEPALRQRLRDVIASFSESQRQKTELSAKFVRQLWLHAGMSRVNVLASAKSLDDWQAVLQEPDTPSSGPRKASARNGMTAERARFDSMLSSYIEIVTQLAEAEPGEADTQAGILKREFQLMSDAFQTEQLEGNIKIVALYRRDKKSRTTAALRANIVGDRRWLAR